MSNWTPMDNVVEKLQKAEGRMAEKQAAFDETFQTNPAYATEWLLDDVLVAQAELEVAKEFTAKDEEPCRATVERFMEEMNRRVGRIYRATSKSTSQLTNHVEDVRVETRLALYGEVLEVLRFEEQQAKKEAERDS